MSYGNSIYPDQNFYTMQVPPAMFGPSAPPVYNSGISQLLGAQAAAQIDPMLQMGQLFLPLVAPQLQQQGGFMPRFFSTQNYMSQMRSQQFAAQAAIANRQSTAQAEANLFEVMRGGLVQLQGKPLTTEQEQSTLGVAQQLAPVMNIASALMPSRLADAIYGNAGNPARLNQQLLTTGQNMYDPVTGRRGLSGESAGAIGERIYNRLYGSEAARSQMAGTGTAELSDLLDNLQQRGLLGQRQSMADIVKSLPQVTQTDASIDEIRRRAVARGETGVTNATVSAQYDHMRALARQGDPNSLNQLRAFASTTTGQEILRAGDADRISRKLKDYNEAVVAIRDIFGDMGQPDAPMAQLMATLDQLTQGGLSTKNPAQLAQSVRKTYELARMNNFSMPVVQGLMAQASAQAQAAGLDPALSVNISQNAMAFGASDAIGRFMENRRFGQFNREKLLLTEMGLQTGAAASPTAQRLGALVAMYKRDMELTPELKRIARVAMGEIQGTFNLEQLNPAALTAELQAAGLSTEVISSFLNNKQLAQEQIAEYDLGGYVRTKLQPQGFRQAIENKLRPVLRNQKLAAAVTQGLIGLGSDVEDFGKQQGVLDTALKDQGILPGTPEYEALMKRYRANNHTELLKSMAASVSNTIQMDRDLRAQFGNVTTAFAMFNPENLAAMEQTEREAAVSGALSGILAPLGRGNAISNFVEQLKTAGRTGRPTDVASLLTNSFGIVTAQTLREQGRTDEAAALDTVMKLAAETTDIAGQANYTQDRAAQMQVERNMRTLAGIMTGGTALTEQLEAEKKKLQELQTNGAAPSVIQNQQDKVNTMEYVLKRGKDANDENYALGAIINANRNRPAELTAEEKAARDVFFTYADRNKLLKRTDGSGDYTRADIENMDPAQFQKVKEEIKKQRADREAALRNAGDAASLAEADAMKLEDERVENELKRVSAPQEPTGVAAAFTTALQAAKLDVKFPDRMKLSGSVELSFKDQLISFVDDVEGSFDTGITPPADTQSMINSGATA